MSTYNNQAAEAARQNVRRPSYGSSTGAPGFPTGFQDTRTQYNPATSGYNPATGTGYQKPSATGSGPSNSYDQGTQHAPSTQGTNMDNRATEDSKAPGDKYAQKGEEVGRKAHGVMAGIHVRSIRLYVSWFLGA
jgi:hypothetical protein